MPTPAFPRSAVWRFAGFELNCDTGELTREGARVRLPPQPTRVLALLLAHAGQLVTREEIRRQIWGDQTFVDFERGLNFCLNRIRAALQDDVRSPRYIETLPRRGYRFLASVEPAPRAPNALAVLPFDNLNRDPEQDFFADGVADALITQLGNISTLRVISRQSVLHFKNTQKTVAEIARELKADCIVEGSVLEAGGRVRIIAQLIQADPEQHLWAKAYECQLGDILTIQGEVAASIAEAIQVALTPAEMGRLRRSRPVDPEAHLAYLKGRYYIGRWSPAGFERGLQYLVQALEKDPAHALAYTELAHCYALLGFWGHLPVQEAYPRAQEAALKALALDDTLSTAHWVLGWVRWLHDWDPAACEAETLRAIQLNPSDAGAHLLYAVFLAVVRGDSRAAAEAALALQLDPLSLYINTSAAWVYLFLRDYERAIEQASKTLDLFPDALQACYVLGAAELSLSRYSEAVTWFEKALAISPDPMSVGYLGHAQARAGRLDAAASLLDGLLSRSEHEHVPPRSLVLLYAGLGDRDSAFTWLEKAFQARDASLFWLRAMPLYDSLRSDPRFEPLLERLGLSNAPRHV